MLGKTRQLLLAPALALELQAMSEGRCALSELTDIDPLSESCTPLPSEPRSATGFVATPNHILLAGVRPGALAAAH
jgi:hypothetical protein